MRRIEVFNRVTPEGYFTSVDGNEQRLFVPDPEMDADLMDASSPDASTVDTFIFGRRTYEHMEAFWPNVDQTPDLSEAQREMGRMLNEARKIVFSTTMKEATWQNTDVLHEFDPDEVHELKQGPGADMMILGSGSIVSQLTEHGLIDEYTFVVSPLLIGQGQPLFRDVTSQTSLELTECKGYDSGNVLLRYRTSEADPTNGTS